MEFFSRLLRPGAPPQSASQVPNTLAPGGFAQAPGFNQGGYNQAGFNQGGFSRGGFNQGGYNQGGFGQGGFGGQPSGGQQFGNRQFGGSQFGNAQFANASFANTRRGGFGIPTVGAQPRFSGAGLLPQARGGIVGSGIDVNRAIVAEIQTNLTRLRYNPGQIDGVYGRFTWSAVRDFQVDRGAFPDGRITPRLQMALRRELGVR